MGDLFDDIANQLTPQGEGALSIGSGLAGSAVGGLYGIYDLATGATPEQATQSIQSIQDYMTYQPRQEVTQKAFQDLAPAMQQVEEIYDYGRFGDEILDAGYSPLVATAGEIAPELLESVVGLGALPSGRRAIAQGLENYANAPSSPVTPMRTQIGAIGVKPEPIDTTFFSDATNNYLDEMGFADSKLDGGKIKVYHGTTKKAAKSIKDSGNLEGFAWVTPDKKVAEQYAKSTGGITEILELEVDASDVVPTGGYLTSRNEGLKVKPTVNQGKVGMSPYVEGVEAGQELITMHNLSGGNLLHADKLGGLPVPSMAVTNPTGEFGSFGDISLLADELMTKPSAKNPFYRTDVYSPRYPSTEFQYDDKAVRHLTDNILGDDLEVFGDSSSSFVVNTLEQDTRSGANVLRESNPVMRKFLRMKGKNADPVYYEQDKTVLKKNPKLEGIGRIDSYDARENEVFMDAYKGYIDEVTERMDGDYKENFDNNNFLRHFAQEVNSANAKPSIDSHSTKLKYNESIGDRSRFTEWTDNLFEQLEPQERFFTGFTPSGTRKYKDATLENITREMKGDINNKEGMHYGMGSYRASLTPRFKNTKEIKGLRDKIVTTDEMEGIKSQFDDEFSAIAEELDKFDKYPDSWTSQDTIMERLSEINKGVDSFDDYYNDVPDSLKEKINVFQDKLVDSPAQYFEGKPQRVVDLSEFKGAVVPEGYDQSIYDLLDRKGIRYELYDDANPASKKEAMKKFSDLFYGGGGAYLGYDLLSDDEQYLLGKY